MEILNVKRPISAIVCAAKEMQRVPSALNPWQRGPTGLSACRAWLALCIILAISPLCPPAYGQVSSAPPPFKLERLMRAEEVKELGLDKLSAVECLKLEAWLTRFAGMVVRASSAPETVGLIETQVDGEFQGWDGETIFRLTNGQIWQQSSYAYTYHYAFRPKVTIFKDGSGFKMKVDGASGSIQVRRIK